MSQSLDDIFTTAATGLSAESIRMNTIASNLANAGGVGSSDATTYHKKYPIFSEITKTLADEGKPDAPAGGVQVTKIDHSHKPLTRRYDPENPQADEKGFVYLTDVNPIEEMTNMIAASKEYQANVDLMNTTKNLMVQSLNVLNEK
jgi:flagellar basal-body rod protein FlgC